MIVLTFDEFTQTTVTVGLSTQLTLTDYNIYICYMFHSTFHSIPFHSMFCVLHTSPYRGYFCKGK